MQITLNTLAALRRPRLLVSAARFGVAQYDRAAVLRRIFGEVVPSPGEACLARLLAHEAEIDASRRSAVGAYSIAAHVDVLAAIMAESRLLAPADPAAALPAMPAPEVVPLRRSVAAVS